MHAIYAVERRTYGDIFFAVSIALCALLAEASWIYGIAILIMAVADGGAAVVGRLWGQSNLYFVFGLKSLRKSVAGTAAYALLVYASIGAGWLLGGNDAISSHAFLVLAVLPILATLFENVSPYGFDNLITPLFTVIFLNALA